jgi:hypothetical protein
VSHRAYELNFDSRLITVPYGGRERRPQDHGARSDTTAQATAMRFSQRPSLTLRGKRPNRY